MEKRLCEEVKTVRKNLITNIRDLQEMINQSIKDSERFYKSCQKYSQTIKRADEVLREIPSEENYERIYKRFVSLKQKTKNLISEYNTQSFIL